MLILKLENVASSMKKLNLRNYYILAKSEYIIIYYIFFLLFLYDVQGYAQITG